MARELGAFPGYEENKNDMLRVMRNHRRAAYDVDASKPNRRRAWAITRLSTSIPSASITRSSM